MRESLNNTGLRAILIIVLLIFALTGSWIWFLTRKPEVIERERVVIETHTDTLVVEKPVPVVEYKEKTVYKEVPVDKVVFRDSLVFVMLPRVIKEYRDTSYYCKISGIEPELDYLEVYNKNTTITQERIIKQKPVLSIGPSVSGGINPITGKIDMSVGISIVIPVYSIYR